MKTLLKFLPLIALAAMTSCKHNEVTDDAVAFRMSDTMLSRCKFADVKTEIVNNELRLFGKITADNSKLAQVNPVVGGSVQQINVELGDYVRAGQILAVISSSEVAEFQKQKMDAMNDVATAEKGLQVARDLFQGKLNTEKDVASAERELEKAKAEMNRMNEVYKIYHLKGGSIYNILAPISGFIVSKNINQNEQLRADMDTPLFSIAEINEVWALANVTESDISKVQLGYNADVKTLSFPDNVYHGKVDKIFNAIDPETKSMKIRVKLPNEDFRLKPEMNATVTLRFSENRELSTVPTSAVIFDKSKYWVMVFKDRNNIETRQVEVYRQLDDVTYISAGLKDDEKVITQGGILIYDALND
ncbi:MAG: efflux RND transporter periplasmic adaptor subunit [Bacteroidota bacterium]